MRGFQQYENALEETEYNENRINLASATSFQQNFNVEQFVQYLGGPHTGDHRNVKQIRSTLQGTVDDNKLNQLIDLFVYGALQKY